MKIFKQNFLKMICVEEEMWLRPSFAALWSTEVPDKFCVFLGCFTLFLNLMSIKYELAIPKQTNGWFI